jgi:hypothetical protein
MFPKEKQKPAWTSGSGAGLFPSRNKMIKQQKIEN